MTSYIRKKFQLSQDNISKLHQWSDQYHLSESELVRRSIQAYSPDGTCTQSTLDDHEHEALAMLEHMGGVLKTALMVIDAANDSVTSTLADLKDENRRAGIVKHVQQEIVDNPGFIGVITDLIHPVNL